MKKFFRVVLMIIIFMLIAGVLSLLPAPDIYNDWALENRRYDRNIDAVTNIAILLFAGWVAWRLTMHNTGKTMYIAGKTDIAKEALDESQKLMLKHEHSPAGEFTAILEFEMWAHSVPFNEFDDDTQLAFVHAVKEIRDMMHNVIADAAPEHEDLIKSHHMANY